MRTTPERIWLTQTPAKVKEVVQSLTVVNPTTRPLTIKAVDTSSPKLAVSPADGSKFPVEIPANGSASFKVTIDNSGAPNTILHADLFIKSDSLHTPTYPVKVYTRFGPLDTPASPVRVLTPRPVPLPPPGK